MAAIHISIETPVRSILVSQSPPTHPIRGPCYAIDTCNGSVLQTHLYRLRCDRPLQRPQGARPRTNSSPAAGNDRAERIAATYQATLVAYALAGSMMDTSRLRAEGLLQLRADSGFRFQRRQLIADLAAQHAFKTFESPDHGHPIHYAMITNKGH
jgi:hypothetical protein